MSKDQHAAEQQIRLAHLPPFRLGALDVFPSTRELKRETKVEALEPRVMQVLVALCRAKGSVVTRDDLIASCWDGRIVGDNAIQRTISRLREIAEGIGSGCFRMETIAKVGYRLVEIAGSPTDAPTPAALRAGTPELGSTAAPWLLRHRVGAGLVTAAFAAVLVALVWFDTMRSVSSPVVLDEVALSPISTSRGDASVSGVARATSRMLALNLSQDEVSLAGGGENRAEFEINGSAGRDGANTYIDMWINERRSGSVIWLRRFQRPSEQLEGFDESVGYVIARDIRWMLDVRKSAHRALDTEQLSLLLNACDAVLKNDELARDATERLVRAAPDFSGAYALKALALADYAESIDHFDGEERAVAAEAGAAARRAIALDPNSAFAYLALGYRLGPEPRYAEREKALLRALEISPDLARARHEYVQLLREVGRLRAAREMADHLDDYETAQVAFLFAMLGDDESAERVMQRVDRLDPAWSGTVRWTAAFWWGDLRNLTPRLWESESHKATPAQLRCFQSYTTRLMHAGGTHLRGLPEDCAHLAPDDMSPDIRMRLLAREGDIEGAYAVIDGARFPMSRSYTMFLFYPEMKAFRGDRQFAPLAEQLGLTGYWRATGQWPDFCSDDGPNIACTKPQSTWTKAPLRHS